MMHFHPEIALQGFGLGGGLIVAIGAQNAFVLRQGLKHAAPFLTALTCAACDAVLIICGLLGAGALVNAHPALADWAAGIGAVFLFVYGLRALRAAMHPGQLAAEEGDGIRAWPTVVATTLGFSLLNPHVYLDTVVLLGGIGSQFPAGSARISFGIGAVSASFIWFFGLAYGAGKLAPLFAKPMAWRILDGLIALTMWGIAASLAMRLLG